MSDHAVLVSRSLPNAIITRYQLAEIPTEAYVKGRQLLFPGGLPDWPRRQTASDEHRMKDVVIILRCRAIQSSVIVKVHDAHVAFQVDRVGWRG